MAGKEKILITQYFKVIYNAKIVELDNETDSIWNFKIKIDEFEKDKNDFIKLFGNSFEIYSIDFSNKTITGMIDSKTCKL